MFECIVTAGSSLWGPGNVDPWTDRDTPQLEKKKLGGWMWVRHALVLLGGTERSGVSSNNTLCIGWEGGLALKLVAQRPCMLASVAGNLNRFANISSDLLLASCPRHCILLPFWLKVTCNRLQC